MGACADAPVEARTHQRARGDAGPFPGVQLGQAIAYEFHLDPTLVPRPGTTLLERVYVLLDLGIQLSNPPQLHGDDAACWYVDLFSVGHRNGRFQVWDQYIDVIVPTDSPEFRVIPGVWRRRAAEFAGQRRAVWWNGRELIETRLLASIVSG